MRLSSRLLVLFLTLCCLAPRDTLFAQGLNENRPVNAENMREALRLGTEFLLKKQQPDGTWSGHGDQPGGVTALCTLALISSGIPADDPRIQKALQRLRAVEPKVENKTYGTALIIMALCMVEPEKDALLIQKHAQVLVANQVSQGNYTGGWSYDRPQDRSDNSNAQFALLGLHEAKRAIPNLQIPESVWSRALLYWQQSQNADGSWSYHFNRQGADFTGTGSMTCAGVASLMIAQSHLTEQDARLQNELKCCLGDTPNTGIERGLDWLGKHFTVQSNPSNRAGAGMGWTLYYLYGVERIGRLSGRRFLIGNRGQAHDWYREGAAQFLNTQNVITGSWSGANALEGDPTVATCFALLFLSKGRRPVVIAKAKWGEERDTDWNRHRYDAANLTAYAEYMWKRDFPIGLSWQVLDLNVATVEDLLQSPVLYISGSKELQWPPQRAQLLRDYIDRGGFIMAEACCEKGPDFDRDFRKLVMQMFADRPEHQLKLLEPTHPIWRAEKPVAPEAVRAVWGVDYGCRTCIVYVPPRGASDPPGNLGCWWQLDPTKDRKLVTPVQRKQFEGSYNLGLNILAYATNRELKSKDETIALKIDKNKPDTSDRALIYLAKLKHPGGCDAAPGALPGILRAAEQQRDFRVAPAPQLIDITSEALFDYHLVFVHGRNGFKLTPAERKQIREYIERGGTILADAVCSSPAFRDAWRTEMREIFPQTALETIPANHQLLTDKYGGFDLSRVTLRRPTGGAGDPLAAEKTVGPPILEGLKVGDRYAMIFSPHDLSCALERHDGLDCEGYSRDDAERISVNVLLYSLRQ